MKFLLLPFALLYGLVIFVRNKLFDWGVLKSQSFDYPVICVGNITVGGTGKTPHVEYLIRLLGSEFKAAVLSRGYGRKTKGLVWANRSSVSSEIGDEPCQLKKKFENLEVIVEANRVNGLKAILADSGNIDLTILDDAFQHRYVKPGFSVLLTDYNRPFYNDFLLPAGRLREYVAAKERADVIIVTKCPQNLTNHEKLKILKRINFRNKPIYFTTLKYGSLIKVFSSHQGTQKILLDSDFVEKKYFVLLVTGIARAKPLKQYLENYSQNIVHLEYSDHYQYTLNDFHTITQKFHSYKNEVNKIIITTEKDAMRFNDLISQEKGDEPTLPFYYLPVEVIFLQDKEKFDTQILNYVRANKRNR